MILEENRLSPSVKLEDRDKLQIKQKDVIDLNLTFPYIKYITFVQIY